jgi:hypothetical protein
MVLSGVSSFINWSVKAQGSVSLNSSMDKGFVVSIFDSAANILNLAICSSIDSVFFFLRLHNSSNASPTESNIENASMRSFLNWVYVPSLLLGLAGAGLAYASSINYTFQVAADPVIMKDNTNAIFLKSLLYVSWLTSMYTSMFCRNSLNPSQLPLKALGLLRLSSFDPLAG